MNLDLLLSIDFYEIAKKYTNKDKIIKILLLVIVNKIFLENYWIQIKWFATKHLFSFKVNLPITFKRDIFLKTL